ncbi:PAS domain-containing protein [Enterovirga sp. DB1703]|uniref:histidine kinase n=2 Tax=Enterovirga aerilata TaxID=2730920 RepID=A0A849I337_9HYPH|nr:PAS domain-containing protein [Enterovirga sp. DB1703]
MGGRIRTYDWASTPLGPPKAWPQELRSALGICLHSSFPTAIYWGPELRLLYNDAWAFIPGERHPGALGQPARDVWRDIWEVIEPQFSQVLGGEGVSVYDQLLPMVRGGKVAETYWNYSITPIRGLGGVVGGIFNQGHETTERILQERNREEEAARQRRLFQQAPGFITVLGGPNHVFEFVNDAYVRLFGDRAYVGRTVREAFPELAGQGFYEWLDRVYETGERFVAERIPVVLQYPGAPAGQRFLDFIYEPVADDAGRVTGIFCEGFDVTAAHQGAQALKDSEERLRIAQAAGGIGTFELLPETGEIVVSEQFCRLWGVPPVTQVPVAYFLNLIHPGDRDAVVTGRSDLPARALEYVEYRIVRPDTRETRWIARRGEPVPDPSGRGTRYFGVTYDITARKQAEADLLALNETLEARVAEVLAERRLFADIVEGTDAFVQVVDPGYRWLAINKAAADEFERIFGVRPAVGESILNVLAHLPEHKEAVEAVWRRALSGEEFTEIAEFGDPDRDSRQYEMKYRVLRDADGGLLCAYQFVYDVTERIREQERLRLAEEALRQAQKMEAVGQLTGGLAHDFNNLLAGISGSLELMQTRMTQGRYTELDRYMGAAQGAAKRAAALTHRLLAFSRRQTLDPKPTNVNRLVAGMEELIRRTVGPAIMVEVVAAGGLWATLVDPPQLENSLLNLCINARDAMPDGGRLTIETANRWLDRRAASERDLQPGQYVSLCVSDTGTGMTPDVVAKAFDPFFTTKPIGQGTGLGLSMIYGFARQSGGQVRIYSEPGQGTMVCLYLPRLAGQPEVAEPTPELADAPRARDGETVLVVDDEPTVRMLVTDVLAELGYAAIEAADGPSGLKVLQSDTRIDLLVTDVGLPGGMNGRQMADAARVTRPGLKVLFITGYAENAAVGNGLLEPGMEVLTKPFAMETLASRIREMTAR